MSKVSNCFEEEKRKQQLASIKEALNILKSHREEVIKTRNYIYDETERLQSKNIGLAKELKHIEASVVTLSRLKTRLVNGEVL